jgi:phage gp36-like protein
MKGYCIAQDVRNALAPLAQQDDNATAAQLSDPELNDAIAEAEGIVDTYISRQYTVVIGDVQVALNPDFPDSLTTIQVGSAPIRGITRDVAAYLSALTHAKGKDMGEDDPIRLRFGVAMGMLKDIRDGKVLLPADAFPPTDQSGDVTVLNQYEPAMFRPSDVGLYPGGYNPQVYVPLRGW